MKIPSELVKSFQSNELVLFVGGDLSTEAGLPSWVELIRPLAEAVGARWPVDERDLASEHLLRVMQHYERENGRRVLVQQLRDGLTGGKPAYAQQWIAAQRISVIFTTTVDDLLEQALREAGQRFNLIVKQTDLAYWSESEVQVVKLCGGLLRPESLVLTRRDFNTYFRERPRLAERLRSTLESKTVLFLGYSLQEPFFNQIWDSMELDFGIHRRRAYAVLSEAEPSTLAALQERDIMVINLASTSPATSLAAWLNTLSATKAPPTSRATKTGEEPPLLPDELLAQATCALMSDGQIGTAWLPV